MVWNNNWNLRGRDSIDELKQVSWNLSEQFTWQIFSQIQAGSRKFMMGDVMGCYFNFKEIAILVDYILEDDEKKILEELENKINEQNIKMIKNMREEFENEEDERKMRENMTMLRNDLGKEVNVYRKTVLKLLDNYNFLVSRKKDSKRLF